MRYNDIDRSNDFQWFLDNYDAFYKQYGISYIAIKNKTVLGSYKNVNEALTSISEPLGTFIVQLCNGDESGYTNYVASNEVGVI